MMRLSVELFPLVDVKQQARGPDFVPEPLADELRERYPAATQQLDAVVDLRELLHAGKAFGRRVERVDQRMQWFAARAQTDHVPNSLLAKASFRAEHG